MYHIRFDSCCLGGRIGERGNVAEFYISLLKDEYTPFYIGDYRTYPKVGDKYSSFVARIPKEASNALNTFYAIVNKTEKIPLNELDDACKKLNFRQVLNEGLEFYKWEGMDEFIEKRIYPYFYMRSQAEKPTITSDYFYKDIVEPLKFLKCEIDSVSRDDDKFSMDFEKFETKILSNILDNLEVGNISFFRKISKLWGREENDNIPERIIYKMAFPNDNPFDKPIPLKVRDILEELKRNKYAMSRQAVQQLCDKMHIERAGGKGGRPKKNI